MPWKWISLLLTTTLLVVLAAFTSSKAEKTDYEKSKDIIVMRKIAHEVLRFAGDSSSRVFPVENPAPGQFSIPFQTRVAFKPDSMVAIIDKIIRANGLPEDYIVNLSPAREKAKVIFGYSVSGSTQTDIIPCLGREQPAMEYTLWIRFKEPASQKTGLLYGLMAVTGLAGLLLLGYAFYKRKTKSSIKDSPVEEEVDTNASDRISIGRYQFLPGKQLLFFEEHEIILTAKEAKLLSIFANHMHEVVDRSRLQKEVWEDEGVIVGRSLDVFISRLRKKFESDPAVRFTTITGKGYKLEVIT